MANNPLWYDAAINAVTALLNNGFLNIYTGSQPALDAALTGTLLATLTFSATAYAASSGGVANSNPILSGTGLATGTAGYFAVFKSDGVTVVATGTVGNSGCDLNMSNVNIILGANVACSSLPMTG